MAGAMCGAICCAAICCAAICCGAICGAAICCGASCCGAKGRGVGGATCTALGGADGAAACTRIEAKLITASGFIGSRDERGALGGGVGIACTASLAIGAIPGGSGGGTERGAEGADDIEGAGGRTEAGAIDGAGGRTEAGTDVGGMLGADTRGATGAGEAALAPCGTFGAIGAFGASGAFEACGRKSDGATRTAGSAASAPPDGVFPDLGPASFAIRKFYGCMINSMGVSSSDHPDGRAFSEAIHSTGCGW